MTQSLSGCLRLRVSDDEVFSTYIMEAVHPLCLPWLVSLSSEKFFELEKTGPLRTEALPKSLRNENAPMIVSDPQFTEGSAVATVQVTS